MNSAYGDTSDPGFTLVLLGDQPVLGLSHPLCTRTAGTHLLQQGLERAKRSRDQRECEK